MASLWGDEFVVMPTNGADILKKAVTKASNEEIARINYSKALKSKSVSIEDKLQIIRENVNKILGRYKENTVVIKSREELTKYIDKAIQNGVIAIDTETNNSLDTLTCILMGGCIYTPGMKNAYIPINHTSTILRKRLEWQLTEKDLKEEFARLQNTKIIMHNGKFDYQVIKNTCGIALDVYWDTMIAARLLNENEEAGLKYQYVNKVDRTIEKYSIEHLFAQIEYAIVEPELFALYAATDAFMTYKLYEYQLAEMTKKKYKRLFDLFLNVEMPIMTVTAEMELYGVCIDSNYANILSEKYRKKSEEAQLEIDKELELLAPNIRKWRLTADAKYHPVKGSAGNKPGKPEVNGIELRENDVYGREKSKDEQLSDPVNIASPQQLAILLYDVLRVPPVDRNSPRSTGEKILEQIDLPICELILKKRKISKILETYVDKIPACVSPKDGRLHAQFKQLGTETGRFSSTEPNLQNIPSKIKEIRMMFVPSPGYSIVGSDFSQQEPRILAQFSQDKRMLDAYHNDKDLYATIGDGINHLGYWENMEHYEDGSGNEEGKKRRKKMKVVYLGE